MTSKICAGIAVLDEEQHYAVIVPIIALRTNHHLVKIGEKNERNQSQIEDIQA